MSATPASTTTEPGVATPYRVDLDYVEVCNCNHGCGCQFAGFPDYEGCEAIIGFEVTRGEFGDVDLRGARAILGAKWPAAIHEGGGHVALFVEEDAPDEQVEALATICSGQAGGMPWEALAATVEKLDGPIRAPIEMTLDGRRSSLSVPGVLDVRMTPLINPVSEQEQNVNIRYPDGGFIWDEGEVCTTDAMRLAHDGLEFEHPGQFAAHARPTWTNRG